MKTLVKLNKAIELIKKKDLKKKGRNKFSNYDYYTPDQVAELVTYACHEVKLYPKFDIVRNELGITGKLSVYDIETESEPIVFEMASAIPEIKATNISQQLGGAMTYTKRYLLMNAFDIVDNNLDFDTTENTKKQVQKKEEILDKATTESITNAANSCKSIAELTKMFNNNPELHKNKSFLKILSDKKKVLNDNGITE